MTIQPDTLVVKYMKNPTFSDLENGRENNFDFLRFFLASCVIFVHCYAFLYGPTSQQGPTDGTITIGMASVNAFFMISGFLITASWLNTKSTLDYAIRRFLRIVPALILVMLLCMFVMGPLVTTEGRAYFTNPKTYEYLIFMTKAHLHLSDQLPGVFQNNAFAGRVNGSLWTIRVEMLCYIMVAVFGKLGLLSKTRLVTAIAIVGAVAMAVIGKRPSDSEAIVPVITNIVFFIIGMAFYLNRRNITYSPPAFLVCLGILFVSVFLHNLHVPWMLLGAYVLFFIAYSKNLGLTKFAKYGDFSYGMYIFAFPIQQCLAQYFSDKLTIWSMFLVAFVLTFICAVLSWNLIEKPCMKLKNKANQLLRPAKSIPEVTGVSS
jgi:peptidoglycan/LPS O-acetylase OafA/YrhL